jgi:hypothetical protein
MVVSQRFAAPAVGRRNYRTPADAVVVYGPVFSANNAEGRPGQLLLTSNGGASWQKVSY